VLIDPDLYDLNRIEILRGPQGTLFGSGSMGGTVRLITNQPNLTQFQSTAQSVLSGTDGGGFNHKDNLMINLPLIDNTLALRLVGSEDYTSGWIDRIVANPFPVVAGNPAGTVRGDVQDAPVTKQYPGSNAYQIYAVRVTRPRWRRQAKRSITHSRDSPIIPTTACPTLDIMARPGPVRSMAWKSIHPTSSARSCAWPRRVAVE
jgi:outer membrane receptor protein involved in Fe transport